MTKLAKKAAESTTNTGADTHTHTYRRIRKLSAINLPFTFKLKILRPMGVVLADSVGYTRCNSSSSSYGYSSSYGTATALNPLTNKGINCP